MKITAKLTKFESGKVRALGSIVIDDAVKVEGIRVIEGEKGLFVAMPQRKNKEEKYEEIVYPVTREAREQIIKTVLDAYNAL
jgi:stage V sporulation protein G